MKNEKQNIEKSENAAPITENLASLPTSPGVYQFKNENGKVIYVGKAKNLRNRVRSYFQEGRPVDAKTKAMKAKIRDLEIIVVDSEAEALILEDSLIKKLKPRYNVNLRDDKSYPYIRITKEAYPRVFKTRRVIRDGSKYFGPYTEVKPINSLLRALRSIYRFRSCDYNISDKTIQEKKYKVCLDYHIEKCDGPCEGLISEEDYNENVRQAIQILNGKTRALELALEDKMNELSERFKFEEASKIRNRLEQLKDYSSRQKIVTTETIDRDVFGLAREDGKACCLALKVREGKMIGKRHFIVSDAEDHPDGEILQRSLERWYIENEIAPKEIYLPCEPADIEYLTDWLGKRKGSTIKIHIPKIGDKKKTVALAEMNAKLILTEYLAALEKRDQVLPRPVVSLQRDLRLDKPPRRIECFDNSHFQGSEAVSSMVVFVDGKPKKSEYRKYKIKTADKNDDFAAMRETISRRYKRALEEKSELPDLVIVDGGKGQLSSAFGVLKELGVAGKIPVVGLAKRLEEIFFPGEKEALLLPKTSSSLRLVQQLRDEAHRFAITFHRSLRDKRTLKTRLLEIEGIGEATAKKLLTEFGSVKNIENQSKEDLRRIVSENVAENILHFFSKSRETEHNS